MRGNLPKQTSMLALLSVESLVPQDHPIRPIKRLVDDILKALSPTFDQMYKTSGRPSVPPERLLKAMLLMAFFSIRSERLLCEQLQYNLLYRWFLDMDLTETPFDHSSFSKNRDRLLEHDVARKFFDQVVAAAGMRKLLSSEHFSVDGTLIEAWASAKSFRPKDEPPPDDTNGFGDFKGTTRTNDTHESTTDPEARLFRKGPGREARLSYMTHAMTENRNGLIVDLETTPATGTAEREAALKMLGRERAKRTGKRWRRLTVAGDKGFDTKDFVKRCRELRVTPHVAQNVHARRSSAIDRQVTRHPGYGKSLLARLLIEKVFGWMKTTGGFRKSRFVGLRRTSFAAEIVAAALNVLRIVRLSPV